MYIPFRVLCLLGLCFVLTTGTTRAEDKPKWGKVTPEEWALTPPAAFPEAAAAVIFDVGELEIEQPYKGNVIRFSRHVRARIFTKAGADQAISVEIPTFGKDDLRNFEATTILPDNKKFKISKKETFVKKLGKNREVFTFTFPAVEDGCIVEYKYDVVSQDFGFLEPWYFQSSLYTYKSQFTAIVHPGLNYTAVTHNVPLEFQKPVREESSLLGSGPVKFSWKLENIYPVESEPYMAAINSYRAALFFQLVSFKDAYNNLSFIKDWASLADFIDESFLRPSLDSDKDVKKTAQELTVGSTDAIASMEKLYDFVRLEIQTVDDPETYSLAPAPIEKILADRNGTAQGKNLLLVALLRCCGIKANPVLIGTRSYALFNPAVHDIRQLNHLICLADVGSRVFLMDAGERWVPFPYLPPDDLVTGGLLISGENSQPIKITAPDRPSALVVHNRMALSSDGSATCSTHVMIMGHLLSNYKELLVSTPESEKVEETLIEDDEQNFELIDYSFTEVPGEDSVGIDMVFRLANYCDVIDNNLAGEPLVFSIKNNPFVRKSRFFPVDFAYPFYLSENVELLPGDSLVISIVPENVSAGIKGLSYSRLTLRAGNQARVMAQIIIDKSLFTPGEYAALRETYEKIANAGSDRFVVELVK